MDSFEELGVAPELVEALAAEGIETPTPLQEAAIPLLRKGNNLVLAAGPGSGLLVSWAVAVLDRVPAGDATGVLVLTADRDSATRLAESLARIARDTGHRVAALGGNWAFPGKADILVGTPGDTLAALASDDASLDALQTLVIDQAQNVERISGLDAIEEVLQFLPDGTQRILSALPVTPAVASFVDRHLKRTLTVPTAHDPASTPHRGAVRYRIASEPVEESLTEVVGGLFGEGARHVLVFSRSEDRAADLGDRLTLRGYPAGAPGDPDLPVWLGVDALEARRALEDHEGIVVVSADVPPDPDTLDRRHGISPQGVVLVLPREVAHLKDVTRRTGYGVAPLPDASLDAEAGIREIHDTVEAALESEDIAPYLFALAPLFERHDPAEIAAAAVALLRKKGPASPSRSTPTASQPAPGTTPSWAKLFVSVGSRDGLDPG